MQTWRRFSWMSSRRPFLRRCKAGGGDPNIIVYIIVRMSQHLPKLPATNAASAAKARITKAVIAKKKADYDKVNGRGKEVLSFLRTNAKNDLEAVEAALFKKLNLDEFATSVEELLQVVDEQQQ